MTEKLLTFKEWVKKVYGITHLELLTKPVSYQQQIHQHYTHYVEAWDIEATEIKSKKHICIFTY